MYGTPPPGWRSYVSWRCVICLSPRPRLRLHSRLTLPLFCCWDGLARHAATAAATAEGRKHFTFFHPEHTRLVHNETHGWADPSKGVAAHKTTHKYYHAAQPFTATIGPGDIIFIPSKWSHQVTSLDNAVSVTSNYIDECNIKACLMPFTKYVLIARSRHLLPPSRDRVCLEALFHLPCIVASALLASMALSAL